MRVKALGLQGREWGVKGLKGLKVSVGLFWVPSSLRGFKGLKLPVRGLGSFKGSLKGLKGSGFRVYGALRGH